MPYCPYCGSVVDYGERFCSSCGKVLDDGGTATVKTKGTGPFPRWILVLLFGSVAIFGAVLLFVHLAKPTAETRGNSVGNIVNGGLFTSQGDWIYYLHLGEEDVDEPYGELCKVRTDGSGRTRLNGDLAAYLNVVGDWLYYVKEAEEIEEHGVYKVRTDGSGRTRLSEDLAAYLNVVGDWLYYVKLEDDECGIYKVRTDGSDRTRLSEDAAIYLNVVGDWLYYVKGGPYQAVDFGHGIYKVRLDGSGRTRLSEDLAAYLNVVGDRLYYSGCVNEDVDEFGIYSVRTDGSGRTRIVEDWWAEYLNVVGDWVYFCGESAVDDEGIYVYDKGIYKVRTDGSERTCICNADAYYCYVIDDWIYFYDEMDSDYDNPRVMLFKVHVEGGDAEIVHRVGDWFSRSSIGHSNV